MVRGRLKAGHTEHTKSIPTVALTCTMIWTSDGKILVIGHPEELSSVHDKYEDAEKAMLVCIEAIKNRERYIGEEEEVHVGISTALEMVKKSFEMQMMSEPEKVRKFLESTTLTVQFTRLGKNAYVIHNMETFKFLSDLSEVGILVPELFLATPKNADYPGKTAKYIDPEILKMLEQMKKGTP